tara:strand:+ start:827 stop:1132 length:306 start_codon:yes stop_codon:yes gene_type:complete
MNDIKTLSDSELQAAIDNYLYLHDNDLIRPQWGTNSPKLLNWVLACARELGDRQVETDYLTRDQMADLLGNDAYIHCNDYEDLEYISGSMKHPKPVGRYWL